MYNQIPIACKECHEINMVAILELEKRPFSKTITLLGYVCQNCGGWELVSVETAALVDLYKRIAKAKRSSRKFRTLMGKAIKKGQELIKKVREAQWQEQIQ